MKKGYIIGIVIVLIWIGSVIFSYNDNKKVTETNFPNHSDYFFVEDYSKVLNESTERFIYNAACRLEEETKAQVVVVTVPGTQASSLEDYSITLANNWGIGDKDLDNGVLLLFDTTEDDPHVRLEIGAGLEGAIPDGKAGRILDDYAVEGKNNGNFNIAAGNTFVAVVNEVYNEYGIEVPGNLQYSDDWGDGSMETAGTFADMAFPEAIVRENDKPAGVQFKDALVDGTFLAAGILVVVGMIAAFIFAIVSVFTGGGGGGSIGRFISSGGGGSRSNGHSGGGGSFRGGGASR